MAGKAHVVALAAMAAGAIAIVAYAPGPTHKQSTKQATENRSSGINCREIRTVTRAGMEAATVGLKITKDSCYQGSGQAIYEAFIEHLGERGRTGHFKFTFNGLDARSGIYEVCSDIAPGSPGEWTCAKGGR